jgi:hypothetical protein
MKNIIKKKTTTHIYINLLPAAGLILQKKKKK